jgi:hypothetical protein
MGTSLDTMALAFVASTAFGNTYNGGTAVDPNAPITSSIVSAIIDAATGIAATQTQINAWLATGETIDQVSVDFSLGDQYSAAIQSTVQTYREATAINAAGLTTVDGVNTTGALTLGTSATPLTANNLTILGGSGPLSVVASGSGYMITELSSSTAGARSQPAAAMTLSILPMAPIRSPTSDHPRRHHHLRHRHDHAQQCGRCRGRSNRLQQCDDRGAGRHQRGECHQRRFFTCEGA